MQKKIRGMGEEKNAHRRNMLRGWAERYSSTGGKKTWLFFSLVMFFYLLLVYFYK